MPGLIERIEPLSPGAIILIKATVDDAAFESLRNAGLPFIDERVPCPGSGQQKRFEKAFARALERAASERSQVAGAPGALIWSWAKPLVKRTGPDGAGQGLTRGIPTAANPAWTWGFTDRSGLRITRQPGS